MALPMFMQITEQQIRDEDTTTLDDHFARVSRDFLTVVPRTHDHISNHISNLNADIANNRFGIDYAIVDDHIEMSMRSMIENMYQAGTEQLFNDTLTRRERILKFAALNGNKLEQKIRTDRINNLNRVDMLATIQDHINEYNTTATHDEQENIAIQLKILSDRAHSRYNLRPELAALADDPYTILSNHAI